MKTRILPISKAAAIIKKAAWPPFRQRQSAVFVSIVEQQDLLELAVQIPKVAND